MAGYLGPWLLPPAPASDSPAHIKREDWQRDEDRADEARVNGGDCVGWAVLAALVVVMVAALFVRAWVIEDRLEARQQREHVEQLQRDGRLPAAIPQR